MAVSRTSRYQTNQTSLFTDRSGAAQLGIVHQAPAAQRVLVRDTLWAQHARVDAVAAAHYRAEDAWWLFARANPATLDWTEPAPGTAVMVPYGGVA